MLPLFSFTLSLPASLPFFSQSFECKTASHFVEFLCRINICNCKPLAGTSVFQGKGGGDGEQGLGYREPQHPGGTQAYRVGPMRGTPRSNHHRSNASARREICSHGTCVLPDSLPVGRDHYWQDLGALLPPQHSPALWAGRRRPATLQLVDCLVRKLDTVFWLTWRSDGSVHLGR